MCSIPRSWSVAAFLALVLLAAPVLGTAGLPVKLPGKLPKLPKPSAGGAGEPSAEAPAAGEAPKEGQTPAALGPTGDACAYPVSLLWHREPKDGAWQMGVSVLNKGSGQQVPGLGAANIQVLLDDQPVPQGEGFAVQQSANTFLMVPTADGVAAPGLGADPLAYDVYFSVDVTESMGTMLDVQGSKPASKLTWALKVIQSLVSPSRDGRSPLFDEDDRVYISGFSGKLETGFMDSTSADRAKITRALATINEFQPVGTTAALYASILHNLANITAQADEYRDPAKKREAVLIVITDSFNGIDVDGKRALRNCDKNDPLTDRVQQAILDTQQATGGNLKVYLLGMGAESDQQYYSLTAPPDRRCRIAAVEAQTLDGRALRAIGNPAITRGGYVASTNPSVLATFVKAQFEALKSAYEVTFAPPAGTGKPRSFKVAVTIGEDVCVDEDVISSSIIPQATSDVDTSPMEVALFLAGLVIALLFVPRSLVNLANLGGGGSAPQKARPGKGKKKRRK